MTAMGGYVVACLVCEVRSKKGLRSHFFTILMLRCTNILATLSRVSRADRRSVASLLDSHGLQPAEFCHIAATSKMTLCVQFYGDGPEYTYHAYLFKQNL